MKAVPYKMIHLGKTYYLYYNQIDSLRVTTNKQGTIIKEIEYDSYGNITKALKPTLTMQVDFMMKIQTL